MASEDSQCLGWLSEVHRLRDLCNLDETWHREVPTLIHELDDPSELGEVVSLRGSQWVLLEERDDDVPQVAVPRHAVPVQIFTVVISPSVDVDTPTAEEFHEFLENVAARCALDDYKRRLNLPSKSHRTISEDRATKTAFPIYETHRPSYDAESFLLVFRTLCIVTAMHDRTLRDGCDTLMASSKRYTGFSSI
jgi:hypothetical protein